MFNISFGEIFVFAIIALIILGPEKLPQTLRTASIKYRQLKKALNKIQQDFEHELELIEIKKLMDEELTKIKANEQDLKEQLAQMQQEIEQLHQNVLEQDSSIKTQSETTITYHYITAIPKIITPYQPPPYLMLDQARKVA